MNTKKVIAKQKAPLSKIMGPHVRQVIPSAVGYLDPFVLLDHFGPIEKKPNSQGTPPHPHAGIATITYLFEGSNRHQDSYGHDAVISAGDLAWMQAGKGIVHAEGMNENKTASEIVHGLQLWISLPADDKFIEPDFFYYPSNELPTFQYQEAKIKVLCGELLGYKSPAKSLSPAFIYDIKIPQGQSVELPIAIGDTCGVYLVDGELEIGEVNLLPGTMAKLDTKNEILSIKALNHSRLIVLGGTPLEEPIVVNASFVMNTKEEILQVIRDYENGEMGSVKI